MLWLSIAPIGASFRAKTGKRGLLLGQESAVFRGFCLPMRTIITLT
jgi:hypothetical protein